MSLKVKSYSPFINPADMKTLGFSGFKKKKRKQKSVLKKSHRVTPFNKKRV
jgi:hypothetical protein